MRNYAKIFFTLFHFVAMTSTTTIAMDAPEYEKEYRVLVLPGGGNTGINTIKVLAQLESDNLQDNPEYQALLARLGSTIRTTPADITQK